MVVTWGLRIVLTIFFSIVAGTSLMALAVSLVFGSGYVETWAYLLFFGGVLLMFMAGLGGVGFGEASLYSQEASPYYKNPRFGISTVSPMYHRTQAKELGRRHGERGPFMIIGFLLAVSLMGLSTLLFLIPG
jgi:hypothetical protein